MKKIAALSIVLSLLFAQCQSQKKIVYINSEMANCNTAPSGKCLQYRYQPNDDWQILREPITGFTYQPGYLYTLEIVEKKPENAVTVAPTERSLVKIVHKEAVMSIAIPEQSIAGKWLIVSLKTDSSSFNTEGKDMFIEFNQETGSVSGRGGCNAFSGKATTGKGNTISFGPLMSTKMACDELAAETLLMKLLEQVNSYAVEENQVVLTGLGHASISLISFKEKVAMLDEGMVESTIAGISKNQWQFEKMQGPGGLENILGEQATINFNDADKRLYGFDGCNRFFGGITMGADGQSGELKMGNIGGTMMACPNMAVANNLIKNLGEVTRYEIRNKRLLLFKNNEQLFELTAILP